MDNRLQPYVLTPAKAAANGLNILIYGDQGVGKTALASTVQDSKHMRDTLICNIEGGLITVASRQDLQVIDIADFKHLEEVFWAIANREPQFKTIRSVIIDSVTELQTINIEEITKKKGRKDTIFLEDWGTSTAQLKRIFRLFRELEINVIMTALPKSIYAPGDSSEPIEILPSLTSKLGAALMGYMDMLWYMYQQEDEDENGEPKITRCLLTQSRGGIRAKTRGMKFAEAIGPVVKSPNISKLYKIYCKSEGVDNAITEN